MAKCDNFRRFCLQFYIMNSSTIILVNSQRQDSIPVTDRGLAFGDGVFETMLVSNTDVDLWEYHYQRLIVGLERLHIVVDPPSLYQHMLTSLEAISERQQNAQSTSEETYKGVWKLMVTRGQSQSGYMPDNNARPTLITVYKPLSADFFDKNGRFSQQGVAVHYCRERLPTSQTLAGIKSLNQLPYVLASRERQALDVQEGLILDNDGWLIEATARNVFMVKGRKLLTPRLDQCGVAGIMRRAIIERARHLGISVHEIEVSVIALEQSDEVFLSNSISGIWPVTECEARHWRVGTVTQQLQQEMTRWRVEDILGSQSSSPSLSYFMSSYAP
ncbi:MAG: 4-amino-4-deoxychorismate lyase [Candidatus Endobugula sp.]|jgi:4-amino-4-deoxychorismate lyase